MRIDSRQVMRYLGERKGSLETLQLIRECADILLQNVVPISTWRVFPVRDAEGGVLIGGKLFAGTLVQEHVKDCVSAALYAVTLGFAAEKLIADSDMLRSVVMNAAATVMLEQACRELEEDIRSKATPLHTAARISPGYGDLPLSSQHELLQLLQAKKYVGIHLTECYAASPGKSLTGIIGLTKQKTKVCGGGCAVCNLRERCAYRRY